MTPAVVFRYDLDGTQRLSSSEEIHQLTINSISVIRVLVLLPRVMEELDALFAQRDVVDEPIAFVSHEHGNNSSIYASEVFDLFHEGVEEWLVYNDERFLYIITRWAARQG